MHVIGAVICVQSGACAHKSCVIVDGNLIINIIGSGVHVLILSVRSADQCAIEHIPMLSGILALGQTRGGTVVGILCRFFVIAHDIAAIHGIVTHEVLHLSLCPVAVSGRLVVVLILIIYQCDILHRRIIPCRTPLVQECITAGSGIGSHPLVNCLFNL